MSDWIVDSSVIAKWILPEADSPHAHQLIIESRATGGRLIVLDLAFPEVANAIWKRHHQRMITFDEAQQFLSTLLAAPVHVEPALPHLPSAMEIALAHGRAIYDALFVAVSRKFDVPAITADQPLYNVVRPHFPQLVLLKDWKHAKE